MIKAKKIYKFEPDYAVPPGETLEEVIEYLNMSKKQLAIRTGLTEQSINRIFKGKQPITYETASKLELTTGIPARMWNNLESQYREQLAKIKEKTQLNKDIEWLKEIPISELINRGAMPDENSKVLKLREALKFYGVSSVNAWRKIWDNPKVAARRSKCFETRKGAASAWIRLGEIKAHKIDCYPYDKDKFSNTLKNIRKLTINEPNEFIPKMIELCAEAGVALAVIKEMKKVPWNGATKWLTPKKAMIVLNLRGKSEDIFWFSFFHEASHVLHDNKKELFIADNSGDAKEVKADIFAAEILIPKMHNEKIKQLRNNSEIQIYAKKLGICPGILAGRYRHLTKRWNSFTDLIAKFSWQSDG